MAITAEAFMEMIKQLDKDGDGEVSKEEYEVVFRAMYPQVSHERYGAIWTQMDRDGDGNLTVEELADYYSFDLKSGMAHEMTDEQILETLSMQAALDMSALDMADDKDGKDEAGHQPAAIDSSIMMVSAQAKDADKKKANLFLETCVLGDLKSSKPETPTVLKFLEEGAIPMRIQDNQGEMPLHKLARVKVTERNNETYELCVRQIFEKTRAEASAVNRTLGQDVNHQDKKGKTPLFIAIEFKNLSMVNLLFSLGKADKPDPLLVSKPMNWTVLHAAVQADDLELLKTLVNKISPARVKVMLQSLSKAGRDPLHVASYHCQPELVKYLLDIGADRNRRDRFGNTAGKLAQRAGRRISKQLIDGETDSFKRMLLERQASGEVSPEVSQKAAKPLAGSALRSVVYGQ